MNTDTELQNLPAVKTIVTDIAVLESRAQQPVTTQDEYEACAATLIAIKAMAKKAEDERMAQTRPLDETKRRIIAFFNGPLTRLATAESAAKQRLATYQHEQERLRREEQRKADEQARAQRAEAERQAAAERAKAEEQARILREKAQDAERAGRAAEAAKLQARADTKVAAAETKAAVLDDVARMTVPAVAAQAAPKVKGISMRKEWRCEVIDPSKVGSTCLMPDTAKINRLVKTLGLDAQATVGAGVRIWQEDVVAAASK